MNKKLTIVIPSRSVRGPDGVPGPDERFLAPTVNDIFAKAKGDIEVIVVLDGYWPEKKYLPKDDKRLRYIHWGEAQGMRRGINAAAEICTGQYIMKTDSHCAFREAFDRALINASQPNWVQIPRRYSLDFENWTAAKHARDYMYLTYPVNPDSGDWGGEGFHGYEWREKDRDPALQKIDLDDTMSFQGSCWFMPLDYFHHLDLMDIEHYGPFWQEAQDIGTKVIADGGRIVRNKRTWYAHLHKGSRFGRGYPIGKSTLGQPVEYTKEFIRSHRAQFEPWVEANMPIPGWPDDWKERIFL